VGQVSASLSESVRHCTDCAAPRVFLALCLDEHADCLDLICAECGAGYALLPVPVAAPRPAALRRVA
jgi:hypothetical protein